MIPLNEGEIHIWVLSFHDPKTLHFLESHCGILSPEEKDSVQFPISRIFLRLALSQYTSQMPSDLRFCSTETGRPRLLESELDWPLSFNLSHTQGCTVLAVGRGVEVGIDVESLHRRVPALENLRSVFSALELELLQGLPLCKQKKRLIQYWVLKEAYLKARGVGFSDWVDARAMSFHLIRSFKFQGWVGGYYFKLFQPTPDHLGAIALFNLKEAIHEKISFFSATQLVSTVFGRWDSNHSSERLNH